MLALTLLGGLRLQSDAGDLPIAAVQRRRLALLVLLAIGRDRGVSRDVIQQQLWPDNAAERARHALDQLLYATRRDLGRDIIVSAGAQLILNADLIRCDTWQFETAVAAGNWDAADLLYTGPLLECVNLGADAECEQLVDGERQRLACAHNLVLEKLASSAAASGRLDAAIHHHRRLVAADPLNSRRALQLMHALANAHDREGAVQHARLHEQLVRQELGLGADPAIAEFVAQLALRPENAGGGAARSIPPQPVIANADDAAAPVASEPAQMPRRDVDASAAGFDAGLGASRAPLAPVHERRDGDGRRQRGMLLLVGVGVLILTIGAAFWPRATEPRGTSATIVAVLPFEASGGAEAAQLATGMTTLLTMNLNGAGALRGVDARSLLSFVRRHADGAVPDPQLGAVVAEHFGAGRFVLGTIVQAGQRLRITATLYDHARPAEPLTNAFAEGSSAEFFALVDRISGELAASSVGGAKARMTQLASVTTTSWPALKAFLQGESAMQTGRHMAALDAFRRAVALDTTFALAYYRLALAISWADASAAGDGYAERAVRFSTRLSSRDRTLLRAFRAEGIGDGAEAERLYRAILSQHPDDVETWFRLGEVQFHSAPLRGGRTTDSRAAFERVVELDPQDADAPLHLARIAALENRQPAFDSMASSYRALSSASQQAWEIGVVADIRRGATRRWSDDGTGTHTDGQLYAAVRNAAVYGGDLGAALQIARSLATSGRVPESRALGHILSGYIAAARGEWIEAAQALRRAGALDELLTLEHAALLAVAAEPSSAAQLFDAGLDSARWRLRIASIPDAPHAAVSLSVHDSTRTHLRLYASGLAAVRRGDLHHAEELARRIEHLPSITRIPTLSHDLASSIRARIAVRNGMSDSALRMLEASPVRAPMQFSNFSPFYNRAHDRYLTAELLLSAGRLQQATRWYESLGGDSFYDLPYMAPAQRRLMEIHRRRGDTARVEAHRRKLASLLRGGRAR